LVTELRDFNVERGSFGKLESSTRFRKAKSLGPEDLLEGTPDALERLHGSRRAFDLESD
jgi:hypothetical protein